jgi:hypothetical protein
VGTKALDALAKPSIVFGAKVSQVAAVQGSRGVLTRCVWRKGVQKTRNTYLTDPNGMDASTHMEKSSTAWSLMALFFARSCCDERVSSQTCRDFPSFQWYVIVFVVLWTSIFWISKYHRSYHAFLLLLNRILGNCKHTLEASNVRRKNLGKTSISRLRFKTYNSYTGSRSIGRHSYYTNDTLF